MKSGHLSMFVSAAIVVAVSLSSISSVGAITINPSGSGTAGTINFLSGNLARGTHAAGGNLLGLSPVETADDPTATGLPGDPGRPGGASINGGNDGAGIGSGIGSTGFHASTSSSPSFWRVNLGDLPGQPNIGNQTYAIESLSIHSRTDCCTGQSNGNVDLFNESDTAMLFAPANLGTASSSLAVSPVVSQTITGFDSTTSITFPYSSLAIGRSLEFQTGSFMEFEANGLSNLILGSGDVLELDITTLGNDFLNVQGTADLSGSTIQFAIESGFKGRTNLLTATSINLTGTQFLGLEGGYQFQIVDSLGGQTLQVFSPVPEPNSLLLCAMGLVVLARKNRRKGKVVSSVAK